MYVDSDDEEAQEEVQLKSARKPVPHWAEEKSFIRTLFKQFGLLPVVLGERATRLFPVLELPVPMKKIGLPVKVKYAVRSSSVNWRTITRIEEQLKETSQ